MIEFFEGLMVDDLCGFYRDVIVWDNMKIVVVGVISLEELVELLDKMFVDVL